MIYQMLLMNNRLTIKNNVQNKKDFQYYCYIVIMKKLIYKKIKGDYL